MSEALPQKEMLKPIPTVATIVMKDSKVLLVHHGEKAGHINGVIGLPSGRVDEGETEIQAAKRELKEETGLETEESNLHEFEGNYFKAEIPRKDGTTKLYGWRVFKVNAFKGELQGSEETTPEWIDLARITQLDEDGRLLPNVRTAIENALK